MINVLRREAFYYKVVSDECIIIAVFHNNVVCDEWIINSSLSLQLCH